MTKPPPALETAHMFGERLSLEHFSEIHRLHTDPLVMQTLSADGKVMAEEATRKHLQRCSDHWNQGFATEMAEASLRFGFERLGLSEIGSWTLPINFASQRVMEKLAFRYEKDIEFADLPHRFYRLVKDWVAGVSSSRADIADLTVTVQRHPQQD